jgi:hypothetical protein
MNIGKYLNTVCFVRYVCSICYLCSVLSVLCTLYSVLCTLRTLYVLHSLHSILSLSGLPLCCTCLRNIGVHFCKTCTADYCLPCHRATHSSPFGFHQRAKATKEQYSNPGERVYFVRTFTVYFVRMPYGVLFMVCAVWCTLYVWYFLFCTLYGVLCATLYCVLCTMYYMLYAICYMLYAIYIIHYTLYVIRYTLYAIYDRL